MHVFYFEIRYCVLDKTGYKANKSLPFSIEWKEARSRVRLGWEQRKSPWYISSCSQLCLSKCSDRRIEVELPALFGNNDRQTNRPTDHPFDRRTDWVIGKFPSQSQRTKFLDNIPNLRFELNIIHKGLGEEDCEVWQRWRPGIYLSFHYLSRHFNRPHKF